MACAKAAAEECKLPLYRYLGGAHANCLPVPFFNVINGGAHADNNIDFQEFMFAPTGLSSFKEGLRCGAEIYQQLKKILVKKNYKTSVGDEGGFAPDLASNEEALSMVIDAISEAGYKPGEDVSIALDVAASEFFKNNKYNLQGESRVMSASEMLTHYKELCEKYPIISIEDPFEENDWDSFANLTDLVGKKTQIVGDDLFVTNLKRLKEGVQKKSGNAILIKLNQIGTLTETIQCIEYAKKVWL